MGIRFRLTLWLLVVLTPVVIGGSVALEAIETRVSARVANDLENMLDLELTRLNSALTALEQEAQLLASDVALISSLDNNNTNDAVSSTTRVGFAELAEGLVARANESGRTVTGVAIRNRGDTTLGRSEQAAWEPLESALTATAMDTRRALFGDAFIVSAGDERLGISAPVVTADGSVVGVLLVEFRLASVVDLIYRYEDFARTSEIQIVQQPGSAPAQLITARRFARSSAFDDAAEIPAQSPAAVSLTVDEPTVVRAVDYRGVETLAAVETMDLTGWGVVVKMDTHEAFSLRTQVGSILALVGLVVLAAVIMGWLFFIRPLGRRLRKTAEAADRVTSGDFDFQIADYSSDEVGHLARSIDRLSGDLSHDIQVRRATQQRLVWRTEHDILTGLANRQFAEDLIRRHDELGDRYGALFLDLDGFKEINDTHGHTTGDEVLRIVAQRLQAVTGSEATVARWGGDEFLVVLTGDRVDRIEEARKLYSDALTPPVTTSAGTHHVGVSIGAATSTGPASALAVLKNADADMFRVKHTRSSYRKVSPTTIRMVEDALADHRIEAFLQPVIDVLAEGVEIRGAEALVRLRREDETLASPDQFLSGLGANALAVAVDVRVLSLSLRAVGRWLRAGLVDDTFRLAANLGPGSIAEPTIVGTIAQLLDEHQVPAAMLQIEIPETVETPPPALLAALRELRVELAIDDVGCQYSNLERLVDVDADVAKIDRRWIPSTNDAHSVQLLVGLVDQCRMLGFDVIAEGIETEDQLHLLQEMGVSRFQGFYFGRPQPIADLELEWLHPNRKLV